MSKADKKHRHEAKRKAKRLEARRRASISPVKRLADAPGELECWISEGFEEKGQMEIFVYKRGGGVAGMAAFLIDRGVVGLKDAWVRMNTQRDEFDQAIENSRDYGIPMRQGSLDEVRRWIAGGLRWAHDNGMRLPKDWAKSASLIGGVGDWQSADVAPFVKEFAGHPEDLRQRLVGQSLESYLQRDDIQFIFNTGAPYMDQKTGDYIDNEDEPFDDDSTDEEDELTDEELEKIAAELPADKIQRVAARFAPAAQGLAAQTASWLSAQGETPSSELLEAWKVVMVAALLSNAGDTDADERLAGDMGFAFLRNISRQVDPSRGTEHDRAVQQVLHHLETDPKMMQNAIAKYGLSDG